MYNLNCEKDGHKKNINQMGADADLSAGNSFPTEMPTTFTSAPIKFEVEEMPYSNIIYIKLFLELFDSDDRFLYDLNDRQQLLYIKLLYLAGRQNNNISKNPQSIIQKINYQGTTQDLLGDIKTIKEVFHKFTESKYSYTFINFHEIHNFINKGKSKGTPKELQSIIPEKEKEKEKEKIKPLPSDEGAPLPTKKTIVQLYCEAHEKHFNFKPFENAKKKVNIPLKEVMALQRMVTLSGEDKARSWFIPDKDGKIPIFNNPDIMTDPFTQKRMFFPTALYDRIVLLKHKNKMEVVK